MTVAFFPFVKTSAKEIPGGGGGVAVVEEEGVPLSDGPEDPGKHEGGVVVVPCFGYE